MEYPSNSFKSKEEVEEKETQAYEVKPIVKGSIKEKKGLSKVKSLFIADGSKGIGEYIISDVLVPVIKNLIIDITMGSLTRLFGQESYNYGQYRSSSSRDGNMRPYYSTSYERGRAEREPQERSAYGPVEILVRFDDVARAYPDLQDYQIRNKTQELVEKSLDELRYICERYNVVKLSEFYEIFDQRSEYTAEKYGWSSLRDVKVYKNMDGYIVSMPRPFALG